MTTILGGSSGAGFVRSTLVAAALVATYVLTHGSAPSASAPSEPLDSIPFAMGEWEGVDAPPLEPDVADVLAADQYVRRYYQGPGSMLEMDVAYYSRPRIGTTMHSPLNCLPGTGWEVASVATRQLGATGTAVAAGDTWNIRELTVVRANTRYALTYWYQSRHRIIADEFAARFHLLGDALQRRPTDASLVRVMMPADGSGAAERDVIARFAQLLIPQIDARLR